MAQTSLFARLLGAGLGVGEKHIDRALELYQLELSQDRYRPTTIESMRRVRMAQVEKRKSDERLLERVEKLTASEDELPTPPKAKKSRRR